VSLQSLFYIYIYIYIHFFFFLRGGNHIGTCVVDICSPSFFCSIILTHGHGFNTRLTVLCKRSGLLRTLHIITKQARNT